MGNIYLIVILFLYMLTAPVLATTDINIMPVLSPAEPMVITMAVNHTVTPDTYNIPEIKIRKNPGQAKIITLAENQTCSEKILAKGVSYKKTRQSIDRGPINVHILKVSLIIPGLTIKPAFFNNCIRELASVRDIAEQQKAIAAVNGSFFTIDPDFLPVGRVIIDGRSIYKSIFSRAVFGLTYNNKPLFYLPELKDTAYVNNDPEKKFYIWGINRPRKNDEVILYTPEYGKTTKTNQHGYEIAVDCDLVTEIQALEGQIAIPRSGYVLSFHGKNIDLAKTIKPGDKICIQSEPNISVFDLRYAINGGPRLIKNSEIVVHPYFSLEAFAASFQPPNARTAIGVNNTNEIIIVVVEKNKNSVGATFSELAALLKELSAIDAIALDGGTSSSIYVRDRRKTFVAGTPAPHPRINNALVVVKE